METTINQRIKMIVDESGKTVNSYAAMIGVSQPTLKACVDGNNAPRFDTLQKILIANPMISAEWLMRGEGKKTKGESNLAKNEVEKTEVTFYVDENGFLKLK